MHIAPSLRNPWLGLLPMLISAGAAMAVESSATAFPKAAIVRTEFIFDKAAFAQCHASTIAQTEHGLAAAWFGGTREGSPDVCIWVAIYRGGAWAAPVEVADGIQPNGQRQPCWNPVLFQSPNGSLLLFYKVGPSPAKWWGMMTASLDSGATWSAPKRLPNGILGPIKDKPILLGDGTLMCPSSTEDGGWHIHLEATRDLGHTWTKTDSLNSNPATQLIQPTILDHGEGLIQLLCRSKEQHIYECWTNNGGRTWTRPSATEMPNPNSGIDAVELRDGRSLLIYNDTAKDRHSISIAISADGHQWQKCGVLESGQQELSYPAIIQTQDGRVHATYTWNRLKIRHVVIDPGGIE